MTTRPRILTKSAVPDPASALTRLRNLDTSHRELPREPEDDGEGPGHFLPAAQATPDGVDKNRGTATPDGLEKVKEAKSKKDHGRKAVYLSDRDGDYVLCPHCAKRITDSNLYTDAKGWTFHRPCMHRGAIQMREKKAAQPFLLDYLLPPSAAEFDLESVKRAVAPPVAEVKPPASGGWIQGLFGKSPPAAPGTSPQPGFLGSLGQHVLKGFMPDDADKAKLKQQLLDAAREEVQNELKNVGGHVAGIAKDRVDQVNSGLDAALGSARDGLSGAAGVFGQGVNAVLPADWRAPAAIAATGALGGGTLGYLLGRRRRPTKEAQMRTQQRAYNAPGIAASNARDRDQLLQAQARESPGFMPDIDPNVALPIGGAAAGTMLADHKSVRGRIIGALRGLSAGGGAALGQHLAGSYSGGDVGSRIAGGLGGGALGYLLARSVTPSEEED
jgi:uncharacterized C2H2 Zn-finger protein